MENNEANSGHFSLSELTKDMDLAIQIILPEQIPEHIKINVKQEQIHDLLFSREIGWQDIIYDLINTEQLDPWDINIVLITDKYMEKLEKLEEADFFISSKVLLAAALLLRIKSELLLTKYMKSIDEILFGRKEEKKYQLERIQLDEEIPDLMPRSPIPRFKKVTLQELMEALDKAIITENRRIKKVLITKNALRESSLSLPRQTYSIKDKIEEIYKKLFSHFDSHKEFKKISFSQFVGDNKEERIISFNPLLHLENQQKIWMEQKEPFGEIQIWMKKTYFDENPNPFEDLKNMSGDEELEAWENSFVENYDESEENNKTRLDPSGYKKISIDGHVDDEEI